MEQQKKSNFVNALAWIFIALAGFATLISILQNVMIAFMFPVDEMNNALESAQSQVQMPLFARIMFSNIRLFFFSFLLVSGTTFISAIGLLKRKNWARIIFIVLMGLGIGWNVFALIMQNSMISSMPDFPSQGIDPTFSTMMMVMKIFSFVFAVGISYLFGWIIYKLTSLNIKSEFVTSLVNTPVHNGAQSSVVNSRKLWIGALVLTILVGVIYFGSGHIKPGKKETDIQQVAISGDAEMLSQMLREQPYLANTDRESDKWTPLHGAACNGNTECVRLLIDAGADVNAQSCNQMTALHCGAEDGNVEIVALLLQSNADPNLRDFKGRTALDWAIWYNHRDVIDLLIKHNAMRGLASDNGVNSRP